MSEDRPKTAKRPNHHAETFASLDFKLTEQQRLLVEGCVKAARWIAFRRLTAIYGHRRGSRKVIENHVDDLAQCAAVGLCVAATFFNPEKGVKFITYAYKVMQSWMKRTEVMWMPVSIGPAWVKHYDKKKRRHARGAQVFHFSSFVDNSGEPVTISEIVERRPDQSDAYRDLLGHAEVEQFKSMIPPRWWEIVWRRANGKRPNEIAAEMGITRQRVHQIEKACLERLRLSRTAERIIFEAQD